MKTLSDFVLAHLGKAVDYDGAAGVQCVDLIKAYLSECFDIRPGSWGDARYYYENFGNKTWLGYKAMNAAFTLIPNTEDFVPRRGDICVFGKRVSSSHNCGHIAIATGEGSLTWFKSYDQNWGGKACKVVTHKYNSEDFLGVLRPKLTVTAALNVRSGPGTSYKTVAELPAGEKVTVYQTKNTWARIGTEKWVSSKYLSGVV